MTKRKITNKIQRLISLALVVVMVFAFVGRGTATEDVNEIILVIMPVQVLQLTIHIRL